MMSQSVVSVLRFTRKQTQRIASAKTETYETSSYLNGRDI